MKFAYLIEPPFNRLDGAGRVTGCDVELARYVFDKLGIKEFEPIETEFSELLPGLEANRWRMTTGLFGTDERRKCALFSRPIWALPDGLLVAKGNPLGLDGYRSLAKSRNAKLAVIRDQIQHRTAVELGVDENRISVFGTYTEAAKAVQDGTVGAYASVGRAHSGFIERHPHSFLDLVLVPTEEKPAAFGSFAFALSDTNLRQDVDAVLIDFIGTKDHRQLVARFGFSDDEVDLVAGNV